MSVEERFFKYVVPDGECWRWIGAIGHGGYGVFGIDYKSWRATHVSYILHKGDIPDGLELCHVCEKHPWCVNPDHLIADTHANNIRMRDEQGNTVKGSKHKCSKLTEEQVIQIREKGKTISAYKLAKEYKVSDVLILKIIKRQSWTHI